MKQMTLSERIAIIEAYTKVNEGIGTAAAVGAGAGAVGGAIRGAVKHFADKKAGKKSSFLKKVGGGALKGAAMGAGGGVLSNVVGRVVGSAVNAVKGGEGNTATTANDGAANAIGTINPDTPATNSDEMPAVGNVTTDNTTGNAVGYKGLPTSTDDYLKSYYGNKAGEIEKNAVTNRFGGVEQDASHRAYNTSTVRPGTPSEYNPGRPDPLKHVNTTNGRSMAVMGPENNDIYLHPNGNGWGVKTVANHEIGHTLNYSGIDNALKNPTGDEAKARGLGYSTGSDDEFASFLGSIRRNAFKHTNGSVDTAKPSDFMKVINNPNSYGLNDMDKSNIDELKKLMNYNGTDQDILKRKNEINTLIKDPKFMGQFVNYSDPNAKHRQNSAVA